MKYRLLASGVVLIALLQLNIPAFAALKLDLKGYTDDSGAISVLNGGDSADPYFAMQALLLAHENGLDTGTAAEKFVNWLIPQQKPDGTFDRFCGGANAGWVACKTADADDSLLALWMKLLDTMPDRLKSNPVWSKSYSTSKASLERLYQPSRGIYMVSPVYLHGLFMDNLEVWSFKQHVAKLSNAGEAQKLQKAIYETFWDPVNKRFLVSTQLEQRREQHAFYPDHVAQIFPLLVDFPIVPGGSTPYYQDWIRKHRASWLKQSETDYPWGILAVLAVRQRDGETARCWLRESANLRHSSRWAVTDEVSYQIVTAAGFKPAAKSAKCA